MQKTLLLSATALLVLLGAGCRRGPAANEAPRTVDYDTDMVHFVAPANMKIDKKGPKLADVFTADQLVDLSKQCGVNRDKTYFEDVLRHAADTPVEQYTVTPKYDVRNPKSWTFTVVPNIGNYADEAALRRDFDNCNPGGQYYPDRVSEDHILFISACASEESTDTAPEGCSDARGAIEPTITLK